MTLLWRKVLECSSSLLTSLSLCPHSLLWRKVLECSSSHCSLRHPCVLTLMEEGSGVFFLTAHFFIPVSSLTSLSLCSHSYGGSFWSVLPHCSLLHPCDLTHSYGGSFWSVLPHCSLRHPCVLTHFVIPVSSLTPMEEVSGVFFLTAHFVIPVSSLTSSSLCSHTHDLSSHPSHRYP